MKSLFKNKKFMLVYVGLLVSSIGDVLFNFGMGLYVLDLTHSALSLAVYSSIGAITWLVLTPIGGVLTDRWDKVKIIYITDFIRGISVVLCGLLITLVDDSNIKIYILYLTSFIIAANGALFAPASQSIIPSVVKKDDLIHANSLMSLSYSIKDVFGMLLAGVLYAILGPNKIIFINGISYILSAISEMFIKEEIKEKQINSNKASVIVEFTEGVKYIVKKNSFILRLLIIINLMNLAFCPIEAVVLPYIFNEQIKAPEIHLSFIYAAIAIGGILGSIIVSKKKIGDKFKNIMEITFICMFISVCIQFISLKVFNYSLISYSSYLIIFTIVFGFLGVIKVLFNVPILTTVQKSVEERYYGRVMSLFSTISAIAIPMSIMFGGVLIDKLGVNYIYGVSLGVIILSLCLVRTMNRIDRKLSETVRLQQ